LWRGPVLEKKKKRRRQHKKGANQSAQGRKFELRWLREKWFIKARGKGTSEGGGSTKNKWIYGNRGRVKGRTTNRPKKAGNQPKKKKPRRKTGTGRPDGRRTKDKTKLNTRGRSRPAPPTTEMGGVKSKMKKRGKGARLKGEPKKLRGGG